ncbi:iron-containing alcohol dehydrogenase [Natranaerofaba carboxydovora]|uniref:iron-containing alcohol dehydrogenase n=1 Tax=Natranaerofaba carboxydovora TaxID=2742683 RepID=UPI001F149586|nr:iron-containing alcohol dehydrogenase [Natranaerofaba carboxydovora]UMZ73635.1 Long-chain-alcohol dehydrogenase 1 [Natranaerofaba carboxydovora]
MSVTPFMLPEVNYFGKGALENLKDEVKDRNAKSIFLVSDKGLDNAGLVGELTQILKPMNVEIVKYLDVEQEPSVENVDKAAIEFNKAKSDMIVALGGGSVLDVAKGISVLASNGGSILDYAGVDLIPKAGIPKVLIPTTSGTGAEVTKNAIFTDKKQKLKKGIVSKYLLPEVAIVDSDLTLSVPPAMTAATGMDALTHAIESYTAPKATIHTDLYALKAIELISKNLRSAVSNGKNQYAREQMALGSVFAGISLANAGVGGVHALAYPLGGQFDVSHGIANALLLPYVLEFNIAADLEKFSKIASAMGEATEGKSLKEQAELSVKAVKDLSKDVKIPQNLADVGVNKDNIKDLASATMGVTRLLDNNPRRITEEDAYNILSNAL